MATLKQKLAVKEITEKHISVSKAMLNVGYNKVTASFTSSIIACSASIDSSSWDLFMVIVYYSIVNCA